MVISGIHLRIVHAGAGQHRADRNLSVGYVQVEFVTAPVVLVSLAVLLGPDVALPRQVGDHLLQFLVPLALDTSPPLACLGAARRSLGPSGLPRLALSPLFLRLLASDRFRKSLAGGDGR
jgi:hypothetical protein